MSKYLHNLLFAVISCIFLVNSVLPVPAAEFNQADGFCVIAELSESALLPITFNAPKSVKLQNKPETDYHFCHSTITKNKSTSYFFISFEDKKVRSSVHLKYFIPSHFSTST